MAALSLTLCYTKFHIYAKWLERCLKKYCKLQIDFSQNYVASCPFFDDINYYGSIKHLEQTALYHRSPNFAFSFSPIYNLNFINSVYVWYPLHILQSVVHFASKRQLAAIKTIAWIFSQSLFYDFFIGKILSVI